MGAIEHGGFAGGTRRRLRLEVTGAVQGVGFRPFIHGVATREGLAGFVQNTASGAALEVEGPGDAIDRFLSRVDAELQAPAEIATRRTQAMAPLGETKFAVVESHIAGRSTARLLPDLGPCAACLGEIYDASNRRYLYPFTTCTQCGPRYTIIEALPYDRERTSMRHFEMCAACAAEYTDPTCRRFHAETNACPACGPQVSLLGWDDTKTASGHAAVLLAAEAVRRGEVVALKGVGGFHLLADARNQSVIARLRQRKQRPAKPFAVMAPSVGAAETLADIGPGEAALLSAPAGPILVLRARDANGLAPGVAPGNRDIGLMLAPSPLHHILMQELGFAVIATSGNRREEPMACTDAEAIERLAGIADVILTHDREIVRRVDDSVVRIIAGSATTLRNARGYAPLVLETGARAPAGLALAGHQKTAIASWHDGQITLGPHIGDLDGMATREAFSHAVAESGRREGAAQWVACDRHPDYFSTRLAERLGTEVIRVPHHAAHVFAVMAEHDLDGEVLGICWDGTGLGEDGASWGGEFLAINGTSVRRAAHLLPFRLPGGEIAAREPRRAALGVLHELGDPRTPNGFAERDVTVLRVMLARGMASPWTSSVGRLFDAVACLLDLCHIASFEGEAAMAVESAAGEATSDPGYAPMTLSGYDRLVLDWRPTLAALLAAKDEGATAAGLADAFHRALADAMAAVAERVGISRIVLSGGCFQNARLTELALARLDTAGFAVWRHRRVPPNDGGLAVGQALFAARQLAGGLC